MAKLGMVRFRPVVWQPDGDDIDPVTFTVEPFSDSQSIRHSGELSGYLHHVMMASARISKLGDAVPTDDDEAGAQREIIEAAAGATAAYVDTLVALIAPRIHNVQGIEREGIPLEPTQENIVELLGKYQGARDALQAALLGRQGRVSGEASGRGLDSASPAPGLTAETITVTEPEPTATTTTHAAVVGAVSISAE